jgi:hypothetical protein
MKLFVQMSYIYRITYYTIGYGLQVHIYRISDIIILISNIRNGNNISVITVFIQTLVMERFSKKWNGKRIDNKSYYNVNVMYNFETQVKPYRTYIMLINNHIIAINSI